MHACLCLLQIYTVFRNQRITVKCVPHFHIFVCVVCDFCDHSYFVSYFQEIIHVSMFLIFTVSKFMPRLCVFL